MSQGKSGMKIGESVFCIGYLIFDLIAGVVFLVNGANRLFLLYGIMTLLLGFGDAFHLVPRVIKHIKGESERIRWWMNFGLAVTSVTMTVFYIILLYIWKVQYVNLPIHSFIAAGELSELATYQRTSTLAAYATGTVWGMAMCRIAICLMPQNDWFGNGNKKLSLCRNIIFSFIGIVEIILFLSTGGIYGITMAVCILFSFLCYIPVTLFAKDNPRMGMLMIPKTVMYIIMISLGLAML